MVLPAEPNHFDLKFHPLACVHSSHILAFVNLCSLLAFFSSFASHIETITSPRLFTLFFFYLSLLRFRITHNQHTLSTQIQTQHRNGANASAVVQPAPARTATAAADDDTPRSATDAAQRQIFPFRLRVRRQQSVPYRCAPVAMVNQIRPGFGAPGQFPGVAVRTAPTQLSTPLQPQRRSSTPQDRQTPEPAFNQNPLFPPAPTPTTISPLFPPEQTSNASTQHQSSYGVPSDIFGSASQPPPFQVQAVNEPTPDLFPRVERASAESLFGVPAAPTPPGRLTQRSSYDNLFGNATSPSTPIGNANVVRSSQSFSYGQTTQITQQREEYPPRSFGAPPPPAAPFLGYAEPSRSQSVRAASNGSLDSRAAAASLTQPRVTPRSNSGALPVATTPPRINVEVRSPEDLLEEFMRLSVNEHGHSGHSNDVASPPSKLMLADIPDKVSSLESLYKQKRWKTLTKKSLSMLQNPSNTPRVTLEIKSWWLAGLIKDGHYDNATSVLDQIGDLDDPQYSSVNNGSEDAFVLIRLRLLEALLSKCKGNLADHEKKMFQLISKIRNALSGSKTIELLGVHEPTASKWLRIGQFTLVNHLLHQQKYALALRVCSTIEIDGLTEDEKIVVISRLGRVHLQMGDLQSAEKLFNLARSHLERMGHSAGNHLEARVILNDGLLFFAQNKLQEALSAFDSVLHLENSSHANHDPVELGSNDSDEHLFLEEDLICSAVNNYAICALYCCDVKGAVAALERMIRINPARFLNAVVVFNLSSLYDLMFDNPTSTSRKEMMKKIAEIYDLEHIDPAAFRI
ncbi:hypothetical protein FI667_g4644, partial [Globisporangium splendens]